MPEPKKEGKTNATDPSPTPEPPAAGKSDETQFVSADDHNKLVVELAAERTARKRSDYDRRIDGLLADGTITPAMRPGLTEFALAIDAADEMTVEFAAAKEGEKPVEKKFAPAEFFFSWLGRLPKIELTEQVAGAESDPGAAADAEFDLAADETADGERLAEFAAAEALALERKISFGEAMLLVEKGIQPAKATVSP